MIVFTLAISLLLGPSEIENQTLNSTGNIQNIKTETVVLVSNNLLNGEISSSEEKNNQNYSGSSLSILAYKTNNNLFNKDKTLSNGDFIHNISTSKQKVHQIRAP